MHFSRVYKTALHFGCIQKVANMNSFNLLVILIGVGLGAGEVSNQQGAYDGSIDYQGRGSNSVGNCGIRERYTSCGANPICQRTCDNISQPGIPCPRTKICVDGCVCIDGYVRSEVNGPCIIENRCPRVRH